MTKRAHAIGLTYLLTIACVAGEPYEAITEKEIEAIEYDDATEDNGFVCPLAASLEHLEGETKERFDEWAKKLPDWEPGKDKDIGQKVRNWLCLAAMPDLAHGEFEAEAPFAVFERLKKDVPKAKLIKAVAWVVLKPGEGDAVLKAPELGFEDEINEDRLRERAPLYAKKLLGRLLGKLPPKE